MAFIASIRNFLTKAVLFIKHLSGFVVFLIQMQRLSYRLWIGKLKFQTAPLAHIIAVYFDPEKIKDPYTLSIEIERSIREPFERIHGFPPIVIFIPEGLSIETGFFEDFVRSLNPKQRNEFKNALYRAKDIEIVSA
ncbi:hypothetical protein [Leptospira licerasiae]|uniref:Uncharacterized protein n=1 Tax=Leptospira licerasiae str. MMD4847 TaxID=1049971 RepID=A0ABN0H9P7_9LEPT|nr:hypothetical protein [Leptospira licerasiae]EIE01451.1 hypothetical protein LEP1GSC185_3917 [Leptospira licerasiae serovar Varillal str. VAR 010]EJZ42273.1 hypothetical protein LEP1GSC178_0083 [Leptospira licerasiae str. MMD4847]